MAPLSTKLMGGAIAAIATVSTLTPAAFAKPSASTPSTSSFDCTSGLVTGTTACEGYFSGNLSSTDTLNAFGKTWGVELLKVDSSAGTSNGFTTTSNSNETAGTWKFDGFDFTQYSHLAFLLKGGPTYSVYLWDGKTTSGTWNTLGLAKGNGKAGPGLSHFSVYGIRGNTEEPDKVPEPASILGLAALAGVLVAQRRQVKA